MSKPVQALIIENGEQLEVSEEEARHLWKIRVIYKCRECNCYHIHSQWDMDDVEEELKDLKVEAFAAAIKPRRVKVPA